VTTTSRRQAGCSGPCIHLQILQANGIHAADMLGFSDPYCALFWRDKCVGTTRVRKLTLDPVWSTETFVLPLEPKMARWIERAALKGNLRPPRNAHAGLPILRIDIFDYDRLSKNDFLGQVSFSPLQLIRVLGLSDGDAKAFRLNPKASRGSVGLKVGKAKDLHHHEFYVIQVENCEDLERADPFSLSDPYCKVYFNDEPIGKTKVMHDNLDPEFDNAFFNVQITPELPPLSKCSLKVEVYDWDSIGEHDLLGEVRGPLIVSFGRPLAVRPTHQDRSPPPLSHAEHPLSVTGNLAANETTVDRAANETTVDRARGGALGPRDPSAHLQVGGVARAAAPRAGRAAQEAEGREARARRDARPEEADREAAQGGEGAQGQGARREEGGGEGSEEGRGRRQAGGEEAHARDRHAAGRRGRGRGGRAAERR
jgi:hypothetical protein